MTRAVYFDCDGTLLTLPDGYGAVFDAACDRVGLPATDAVGEAYSEAFFAAFEAFHPDPYRAGAAAAVDASDDAEVDATADADAEVDADAPAVVDVDAFAEAIRTVEVERAEPCPAVVDALDSLPSGDRVGVLTNGVTTQQRRKLAHHDLLDRVEVLVASYDVGAHKPDAAVFDAAKDALAADEYVYVGDSVDHDVVPARENGFRSIHPDGAPEADGGLDAL